MPMSHSASSSPTPSSTSRVMMRGLIGPDLLQEDCRSGPSHDDWRKTCLIECCRSYRMPPKKLGTVRLRSRKDATTFVVPPTTLSRSPLYVRWATFRFHMCRGTCPEARLERLFSLTNDAQRRDRHGSRE